MDDGLQLADPGKRAAGETAPAQGVQEKRLSTLLREAADGAAGDRVSLGDLVDAFGARAFGALIVVFAAPNILPVALPGISAILGAPLLLLTWQLMVGREKPWLPAVIRGRSLLRRDFVAMVDRIAPRLARIERMVRPRWLWLTTPTGERLIGAVGLLLATLIFLPIPLGNALPGLALVLMALGVLERDGVAVLAGGAVGALGVAVVSGVVYAMVLGTIMLVRSLFGT